MSDLFISFFLIGLSAFGGGMVTITLIYHEIVDKNNWISPGRMNNIITIAQLTPGPISINSATFIGFTLGSVFGAIIATTAVLFPSLVIMTAYILLSSKIQQNLKRSTIYKIKQSIKPGILALLGFAIYAFGSNADLDIPFLLISISCFISLIYLKKIHPIILFLISGIIGIIIY